MPTMSNNSLMQIGGPKQGQCGMRAKAGSADDRSGALTQQSLSLSSLPPKPQLGQELLDHYLDLDVSVGDVSLSTVGDVCLDEGEIKACAQVSVNAGDSSLVPSRSQLTHGVSPECEPSLPQPWKTVHRTAGNSLDVCASAGPDPHIPFEF